MKRRVSSFIKSVKLLESNTAAQGEAPPTDREEREGRGRQRERSAGGEMERAIECVP